MYHFCDMETKSETIPNNGKSTHTYIYIYIHVYISICMHMHVRACVYIYIYIYGFLLLFEMFSLAYLHMAGASILLHSLRPIFMSVLLPLRLLEMSTHINK